MKLSARMPLRPLAYPLTVPIASAALAPTRWSDVGISFVEGMSTQAVGLTGLSPAPPVASMQVLPWRHFLKMIGILASRVTAKMVSVATLCGPTPMSEKLSDSMRRFRAMKFLYPNMAVTYGVFRRLPFPAITWPAFIHFRPIAFCKALGARSFSHGYMIPHWYE